LLRGGTEAGYASLINNQLIPHLGKIRVARLRFEHVEAAVGGMVEDQLAPKTIRNAVMLLKTMLWGRKGRAAFRRGLVIVNPTFGVRLPSVAQRQTVPPAPDQVWRLIDAAKAIGGAGYPITYPGAFCGMRRNEILALRLEDVRWFENEIRVRHAITRRHAQDGVHK
jgi:integrase